MLYAKFTIKPVLRTQTAHPHKQISAESICYMRCRDGACMIIMFGTYTIPDTYGYVVVVAEHDG